MLHAHAPLTRPLSISQVSPNLITCLRMASMRRRAKAQTIRGRRSGSNRAPAAHSASAGGEVGTRDKSINVNRRQAAKANSALINSACVSRWRLVAHTAIARRSCLRPRVKHSYSRYVGLHCAPQRARSSQNRREELSCLHICAALSPLSGAS